MEILQHPLATEKAIRAVESDNIITFIVERKSTKNQIKKEFESKFKAKIGSIKTIVNTKGKKKAYIRLSKETNALDVATQLGLM